MTHLQDLDDIEALSADQRSRLAAALRLLPGSVPGGGRGAAAARLSGASEPAAPGTAPILAVLAQGEVHLWACRAGRPPAGLRPGTVAPSVEEADRRARAELARLLPLSGGGAARDSAFLWIDGSRPSPGPVTQRALEGASGGLSMGLALASAVLGVPMPARFAASAELLEGGRLGAVEGLDDKLWGMTTMLPAVEEFLVSADQPAPAADLPVTLVRVATLDEALQHVFGERYLTDHVARTDLPRLARGLFASTQGSTSGMLRWGPVLEAAKQALAGSPQDDGVRGQLEFVRAVAARHCRAPAPPLPNAAWVTSLVGEVRLGVLAHLVEHHSSQVLPLVRWLEDLVDEALEGDTGGPLLRLRGALARHLAALGQHARSLEEQVTLVRGWRELFQDHEVSHSLSEWLRLSGALGLRERFSEALALRDDLDEQGADPVSAMYQDLSEAIGRLGLGEDPGPAVGRVLGVAASLPHRDHCARVARRVLAAWEGRPAEAPTRASAPPDTRSPAGPAAVDRALVQLYLGRTNLDAVAALLDEPGARHLRAAAGRSPTDPAAGRRAFLLFNR